MSERLGDTARLTSMFPSLRFALWEFNDVMSLHYPFIGCHVILHRPVRQGTIVSIMLSSTPARLHYFDASNTLLSVARVRGPIKKSCHYIPSKISRLLLHRGGSILPEEDSARGQAAKAWDAISWDFQLLLLESNANRKGASLADVLPSISDYLFPAICSKRYADGRHRIQITCDETLLPHVMALVRHFPITGVHRLIALSPSQSGALPCTSSVAVGIPQKWLHVAEFAEIVKAGAKQYFAKRKEYLESLPTDQRQEEESFTNNATDLQFFPEIKRRGIRAERIFIEVHLLAEYGDPMPEEDGWLEDDGLLDDEKLLQVWILTSRGPKSAQSWTENELIVAWD